MKKSARKAMTEIVEKYVKENYKRLNEYNNEVDENIFKDLKKDETILDWLLYEVLNDFWAKTGWFRGSYWDGEVCTLKYNINGQGIKRMFTGGEHNSPHRYEFIDLDAEEVKLPELFQKFIKEYKLEGKWEQWLKKQN